jgi:hypothetical protein
MLLQRCPFTVGEMAYSRFARDAITIIPPARQMAARRMHVLRHQPRARNAAEPLDLATLSDPIAVGALARNANARPSFA